MKFKTIPPEFGYDENGSPLTFAKGPNGKGYEIRLFGPWNYGYPDSTTTYTHWSAALMTAFGALNINTTQGVGLILGSLLTQDYIIGPKYKSAGVSWVWSTLLGFNLYHYLLKRNNSTPVFLASWYGSGMNLWLVGYEAYLKEALVSHTFHVGGQQTGFIIGAILDAVFGSGKVTFNITPRFLTLLGFLLPMVKGQYNETQLKKKVKGILALHPHITTADLRKKLAED